MCPSGFPLSHETSSGPAHGSDRPGSVDHNDEDMSVPVLLAHGKEE